MLNGQLLDPKHHHEKPQVQVSYCRLHRVSGRCAMPFRPAMIASRDSVILIITALVGPAQTNAEFWNTDP